LVDEGADITKTEKATRAQEADWLGRLLAEMDKGKVIPIVAEVDGKVVGNSEVEVRNGAMSHRGGLGISVRSGYRNLGIGTEMIKMLIEESHKVGLSVLVLTLFSHNDRARHVYEKLGFKETGRIPKGLFRNRKYIDEVIMTREI
jgi:RimJ/RimL family protein N-acetyltransferase